MQSLYGACSFPFLNQELFLLKERAIYWKNQSILLISDLHLGKVGHFRKQGLAVPADAADQDYQTLDRILQQWPAEKLIIAGDFSHSEHNEELERFHEWQSRNSNIQVILVRGNHDILPKSFYQKAKIQVVDDQLEIEPFIISHKPLDNPGKLYNIAGHIHPGVELSGKARQSLTLSCFYFGKKMGLLPAFGSLTGNCRIGVKKGDRVFVILTDQVREAG